MGVVYSMGMKPTVKQKVKELRRKGLSFTEIGRILGFTRQRAHQIYHDKQH
jgi:transcriptional regulator